MLSIQEIIRTLETFWTKQGCTLHFGYDVEKGAGTFNPPTFFHCLGPEPYRAAYVERCRRPKDGRYGQNPNRMQLFHQYQVILKPSPPNIQELYLQSLEALGFHLADHDMRFVHDDWEQPTLGAWGLGWEVWRDGMEVSQFTYFQAVASMDLHPITVELTYGLERIALSVQDKDSVWDLLWDDRLTYRELYHRSEVEWSTYNFEEADISFWRNEYQACRKEAQKLLDRRLCIPSYDFVLKASHAFNVLDARGVVSVTERTGIIADIRDLARQVAEGWVEGRKEAGFPLLGRSWPDVSVAQAPTAPMPKTTQGADDFVLEIGSEELPATFVPIGMRSLAQKLTTLLKAQGVPFETIEVDGTPRRLAATVRGLERSRPMEKSERRGPPKNRAYEADGSLTKAGKGFIDSLPEETPIEIRAHKGNDYLFATVETPPKPTAEILAASLPKLIADLDFPKKMRWGSGDLSYARPLHWILALHGADVIPFSCDGVVSGAESRGHPQICPGSLRIQHARDYRDALRQQKVLVSVEERKNALLEQLADIEEETDTDVLQLQELLPESVHLVEWPLATTAPFDSSFLKAPQEVLISEMVQHQKYFPLASKEGSLTNRFVIVCDTVPTDVIRHGNVKVLSARLADGVFLYTQDLKISLDQFNERLKMVTYRAALGSVFDKAQRVARYIPLLHQALSIGSQEDAKRAATLCKADLASELVQEFPQLQGVVGRHYALAQGEKVEVATAIEEHWLPRGEKGALPSSSAGILVSLGDKIDNLLAAFALGQKPTSSSDPYGLRRQVLGIIRSLVHAKHHLDLFVIIEACYKEFVAATDLLYDGGLVTELRAFFTSRIKTVFTDYGLSKEESAAALSGGLTDIYDGFCRVQALHRFREDPRFAALAEVYKRAKGQVIGHEEGHFSTELLVDDAEKALAETLSVQMEPFDAAMAARDYDTAYQLLARLQPKLADLFDHVRILANEPRVRQNRIALLERVFALFGRLLDFSQLRL